MYELLQVGSAPAYGVTVTVDGETPFDGQAEFAVFEVNQRAVYAILSTDQTQPRLAISWALSENASVASEAQAEDLDDGRRQRLSDGDGSQRRRGAAWREAGRAMDSLKAPEKIRCVSCDPKERLHRCDVCRRPMNSGGDLTDKRKRGEPTLRICYAKGCWDTAAERGYR